MQNLMGLTAFIRAVKAQSLGFSAPYIVPDNGEYSSTANKLIAIAGREQVKISVTQVMIVDPSSLKTIPAVKVTRK